MGLDGDTTRVTDVDPRAAWLKVAGVDIEDNPPGNQDTPTDSDDDDRGTPADASDADSPEDSDQPDESDEDEPKDEPEDESDEDEPKESKKLDPKDFLFDVEGEEVDGDELIKRGLRQSDYTRKSQALAKQRDSFAAEQEAVREERQKYASLLTRLEDRVKKLDEEPNWDELRRSNPQEYAARRADWQDRKDALKAIDDERQALLKKAEEEFLGQQQQRYEVEHERLIEALPTWKEDAVAMKEMREVYDYGLAVGFTQDELASTVDHRAIVALRKAMLYDKMHKGPASAVRKKARRAPALKPGAPKQPQRKGTRQRMRLRDDLKKTGSVKAAAAVIFDALEAERL